jgi:hypothetical protein
MDGIKQLTTLFEAAEKAHPDLMEPYSVRLAEAADAVERAAVMRAGLRETFRARWPMPEGFAWPEPATAATSSSGAASACGREGRV